MCSINENRPQRPLDQLDVIEVCNYYGIDLQFGQLIYKAITDHLVPKIANFVLICDLIKRFYDADYGRNQDFGPWIPLSAISLDGTNTRYLTPAMEVFENAFVHFNMSKRNIDLLNEVLAEEGIQLVTCFCCCLTVLPTSKVECFLNSKIHLTRNFVRSVADSTEAPIFKVGSFDEISTTIDMGSSERQAYSRMEEILSRLPCREVPSISQDYLDYLLSIDDKALVAV